MKTRFRSNLKADMRSQVWDEINSDWFRAGARRNFLKYLHLFPVKRYLEMGSWEGASLFWIFENKQPEFAIAIDPYPADRHREEPVNNAKGNKLEELWAEHFSHVSGELIRKSSMEVLPQILVEHGPQSFDFVYVDGSHHGHDVYFDAALSGQLVRPGGWLIFDDFQTKMKTQLGLQLAVETYARVSSQEFEVPHVGRQLIMQRREKPARGGEGRVRRVLPPLLER